MIKTGRKLGRKKGSRCRFKGIGKDSISLGVESRHLYRVLTGERRNAALLARYNALKLSRNAAEGSLHNLSKVCPPRPNAKTTSHETRN